MTDAIQTPSPDDGPSNQPTVAALPASEPVSHGVTLDELRAMLNERDNALAQRLDERDTALLAKLDDRMKTLTEQVEARLAVKLERPAVDERIQAAVGPVSANLDRLSNQVTALVTSLSAGLDELRSTMTTFVQQQIVANARHDSALDILKGQKDARMDAADERHTALVTEVQRVETAIAPILAAQSDTRARVDDIYATIFGRADGTGHPSLFAMFETLNDNVVAQQGALTLRLAALEQQATHDHQFIESVRNAVSWPAFKRGVSSVVQFVVRQPLAVKALALAAIGILAAMGVTQTDLNVLLNTLFP